MLDGACVFSTFDLRSAYHQIELTDDSRSYTSFFTPHGLFQFMRMLFGLASVASVFQRAMYHIFKDVAQFVKCFQDDILIFSKNVEEQNIFYMLRKFVHDREWIDTQGFKM